MHEKVLSRYQPGRRLHGWLIMMGCVLTLAQAGCGVCGEFLQSFNLSGIVLDAETSQPLTGSELSIQSFTDGSETGRGSTRNQSENPPDENGLFEAFIFSNRVLSVCIAFPPPSFPPDFFPAPDQLEITVTRDDCEQRIMIDLNEDTVVDITFPNDLIDLKDPILVPACEP